MSLLENLKKQAESVRQQAEVDADRLRENARAVDLALRVAFKYLDDFSRQMNVLQMPVETPYRIPEVAEFRDLRMQDFHADYRTGNVGGKDRFSEAYVSLRCVGKETTTVRQDVAKSRKLRDALWQFNVTHTVEEIRNLQGVVTAEVFRIRHDFPVQVSLEGDHDRGLLKLLARNLNEFGTLSYFLDARRFDEAGVEELAKQIIGQPSRLRELIWKEELKFTPAAEKPIPNYVIHDVPDEPEPPPPKPSLMNTMRIFIKKQP